MLYDFSLTILYIHYIPNNIKALFRNFSTKKGFIQFKKLNLKENVFQNINTNILIK